MKSRERLRLSGKITVSSYRAGMIAAAVPLVAELIATAAQCPISE
jgi:hypothetical protein